MPPAPMSDPRVRWFHSRGFCLRAGDPPDLPRASGDSGFVAHLAASTHGATGWDWSFRLVRPGNGWAFVSDGRLTLFLDEPNQYVPAEARPQDLVAVRLPRARENLYAHRFTLYGGQGGVVLGPRFSKFFVPIRFESASSMVDHFSGKGGDTLRFSLHIANAPADFERADSAVIDVGSSDEPGVTKLLESFARTYPEAFKVRGMPHSTVPGILGLPKGEASGRADVGDGFGWRVSAEAAQRK